MTQEEKYAELIMQCENVAAAVFYLNEYANIKTEKKIKVCPKCGGEGWLYLRKGAVKKCNKC